MRQPSCDKGGVGSEPFGGGHRIRKISLKKRKAPLQNGSRCIADN
jgi:hypothetical protein